MRRFAALLDELDAGAEPEAALARSWAGAAPADAAWSLFLLCGGRLRAALPAARLRAWGCAAAGIDGVLFDSCLKAGADLAETVALAAPPAHAPADEGLAQVIETRVLPLPGLDEAEQGRRLQAAFDVLDGSARVLFVRLLCGSLRPGVGRLQVQRALARHAGIESTRAALRLAAWPGARRTVGAADARRLLAPQPAEDGQAVAAPLARRVAPDLQDVPAATAGAADVLALWAYDGLRVQIVRRGGACRIWAPPDELLGAQLPELQAAAQALPEGCVLEGEVLVWPAAQPRPAPCARLAARLARVQPSRRAQADAPLVFVADDLLEEGGRSLLALPAPERHARLQALLHGLPCDALRAAPRLEGGRWSDLDRWRAGARAVGAAGLRLRTGPPGAPGDGGAGDADRLWRCSPFLLRAVPLYAEPGRGPDAARVAACGLALWSRTPRDPAEVQAVAAAIAARRPPAAGALQLVPLARVPLEPGSAAAEAISRLLREHPAERYGPVRSLQPRLLAELAFDGLEPSARHRCGALLLRPRLLRILSDAAPEDADALPALHALLPPRPDAAGTGCAPGAGRGADDQDSADAFGA